MLIIGSYEVTIKPCSLEFFPVYRFSLQLKNSAFIAKFFSELILSPKHNEPGGNYFLALELIRAAKFAGIGKYVRANLRTLKEGETYEDRTIFPGTSDKNQR